MTCAAYSAFGQCREGLADARPSEKTENSQTKVALIPAPSLSTNLVLLPWMKFAQNLLFWQATWFLYMQGELSAAEAVLLYAIYDVGTTVIEIPSGYMSDRIGRRITLLLSAASGVAAMTCFALGDTFMVFATAQILLGASVAFASGTDSSLLYESLVSEGRADEVEAQELRLWRFTFAALMVSAITGGLAALAMPVLPFVLSGLAFVAMLGLAVRLQDAPPTREPGDKAVPVGTAVAHALRQPILLWLFVLSLLMYAFSHVPFVFGQPFIFDTLALIGLSGEAPLVSGAVTTVMMALSVAASFAAPKVRRMLGLAPTLLFAFALQITICAVLALSQSVFAIAILFLRMVPNSLSRPFILARTQPLLQDGMRATFLSVQSFCGRVVFALSLWLASRNVSDVGEMPTDDLSFVLGVYAIAGAALWIGLATAARRNPLD